MPLSSMKCPFKVFNIFNNHKSSLTLNKLSHQSLTPFFFKSTLAASISFKSSMCAALQSSTLN